MRLREYRASRAWKRAIRRSVKGGDNAAVGLEELTAFTTQDPTNPWGWRHRVSWLLEMKEFAAAESVARDGLRLHATSDLESLLCVALRRQRRWKALAAEAGRWQELEPNSPLPPAFLGVAALSEGRREAARAYADTSYERSKGFDRSLSPYLLGTVYAAFPDSRDRAIELLTLATSAPSRDRYVRNAHLYLAVLWEGRSEWHVRYHSDQARELFRTSAADLEVSLDEIRDWLREQWEPHQNGTLDPGS